MVTMNGNTPSKSSLEYAKSQDAIDELRDLRKQFIFPSKSDLTATHIKTASESSEECIYLCGNSLGLQPKVAATYVQSQLAVWAKRGVHGHFNGFEDSVIPAWLDFDEAVKPPMAKMVGASESEIAVMATLTANLHFLMCSFYKPTSERYRIIIEGKAFPSDHYAVESQIRLHGRDPADALTLIEPPSPDSPLIPTEHILSVIDAHASTTALLLLPGIQFYTGQFLDIQRITQHAQNLGITVGWDLAHAVGNVPLQLHDWNVDFAAWCTYKYVNCGPGAMGGLFVHSRHSSPPADQSSTNGTPTTNGTTPEKTPYRARLEGWWGSSKSSRFAMNNIFHPIPGAGGFQLSNPSALDLSAIQASMSVFAQTNITALREKSLRLTGYLEELLLAGDSKKPFEIITPSDPAQRGAQLSLKLAPGLLDNVLHDLEAEGVVIDERKPDVIRVAPAPLYNNFEDAWRFVDIFGRACEHALALKNKKVDADTNGAESVALRGGKEGKGWSEIK